ncbi:MAG TPA: HAD family hydrolase [Polyangiaceae bacterium]|nr:HAD family hydrolase [Polyangiaceae bacterium]
MVRRAALFDMDKTLIRRDSATLYTRYRRDCGDASFWDTLQVAYWALQYTLGIIDAPKVAAQALESFKGKREAWLLESCESWFTRYVLPHVCAEGRRAVARHREDGDVVAIVTGATPYAAMPLARELGIEHVVCTELEVGEDGCFTGSVREPLCYGSGKLERAQCLSERFGFRLEDATFYSDSITDLPLLERVRTPVAVNPDGRLRRIAERRKWRIEQW